MKTLLTLILLAIAGVRGVQAQGPEVTLWPVGGWVLCQALPGPWCASVTSESPRPYLLTVHSDPTDVGTVGFIWTITGTLTTSGVPVTRIGIDFRADNPAGFTNIGVDFGGEIRAVEITVTRLISTQSSKGIPVVPNVR